jgi:papain like cysteine protease AvrRpt2
MIVSWARGELITPSQVAKESNRSETKGHFPLDAELFDRWGMVSEAPQTFSAEGFMNLLAEFGPIWVAAEISSIAHVRVATGFEFGDPPHLGPIYINDPLERGFRFFRPSNKGSRYTETYQAFVENNERLGSAELSDPRLNDDRRYPVYFAHLAKRAIRS